MLVVQNRQQHIKQIAFISQYVTINTYISGEVNNTDCLVIMAPVSECKILRKKKKGKRRDFSEFDEGQTVMGWRLGQSSFFEVCPVCSGHYLSQVVQRKNSGEPAARSLMPVGIEGWLVWSDPTYELLYCKLMKTCQNILCITVCCVLCCIFTDHS